MKNITLSIFLSMLSCAVTTTSFSQTWIIPSNSSTVGSSSNNAIGTANSGANTNYFSIKSGGNERMRFPVNSGVGIGILGFPAGWSTGFDLEIYNNGWPASNLAATISSVKTNFISALATDNSGSWLNPLLTTGDAILIPQGGSAQDLILSSSSTNSGMIRFSTGSTLTERMTIKDNGNVLINFGNTPACNLPTGAVLGVNGSIYATGIKVELNNSSGSSLCFPDYVFEKNYVLTPLTDLKKFIQQNHHLPGIPKAEEVESNGMDLVEMNTKLLEKIEELTLYMIQTNEKVEQLQKENEVLKNKINKY